MSRVILWSSRWACVERCDARGRPRSRLRATGAVVRSLRRRPGNDSLRRAACVDRRGLPMVHGRTMFVRSRSFPRVMAGDQEPAEGHNSDLVQSPGRPATDEARAAVASAHGGLKCGIGPGRAHEGCGAAKAAARPIDSCSADQLTWRGGVHASTQNRISAGRLEATAVDGQHAGGCATIRARRALPD
jgi:hypothetical protein